MLAALYLINPELYAALKRAAECRHALVGWDGPSHVAANAVGVSDLISFERGSAPYRTTKKRMRRNTRYHREMPHK